MKKIFLFSAISCLLFGGADATTPWWEQPTICRLSPSNCYASMVAGFLYDTDNPSSWDITSNCWGKKYICAEALKNPSSTERVALGRTEIADASRINSDFDIAILNAEDDCFGVRKTSSGGAMASVNGNFVRVWCTGILENPDDEPLENGEITTGAQPQCSDLADRGYVEKQNGNCYGKYYSTSEYLIQCDTNNNPTLIVLNGVNRDNTGTPAITTRAAADTLFDTMYNNARAQHQNHFSD